MFKKSLATLLATITTLSGFGTLFTVSALVVSNPLLTSPARAETLDNSRGIQFLSSHKDVLNKVINQVWEQDGRKILSYLIASELRELNRGNPYFAANKIDEIVVTTGGIKTDESTIFLTEDGSAVGFNFALKNNAIRFKVKSNSPDRFPFSGSALPAEAIVDYDLNISLTMNTRPTISSICSGLLLYPYGRMKIRVLNSTGGKLYQNTDSIFNQDYGMSAFFRKIKSRFDRETSTTNYLATKIQLAIEQNVPAEELKQPNRKVRVFRGQKPVVTRSNVCPEYIPPRNQPE
jgi:hypothetical protein